MTERVLPVGSVVTLNMEETPEVMVIGFYPNLNGETHDYLGVPVPTGLFQGGGALAFNKDAVVNVLFEASATDDELALVEEYVQLHKERLELASRIRDELSGAEVVTGD